jgi:hypothetical protein
VGGRRGSSTGRRTSLEPRRRAVRTRMRMPIARLWVWDFSCACGLVNVSRDHKIALHAAPGHEQLRRGAHGRAAPAARRGHAAPAVGKPCRLRATPGRTNRAYRGQQVAPPRARGHEEVEREMCPWAISSIFW